MKLALDILQGLGLASAAGLRPFLPAILAGALASGDIGLDFDGTSFAFLESPIWLLILVIALVATIFTRKVLETGPGEAALSGVGIGLGALLCAASIDDRHDTWWYGLILGAVVLIFLLIFILQNLATATVFFLGASGSLPLAVAMHWR